VERKAAHQRRRPRLVARGRIVRALRRWFEDAEFTEVETPALQVTPCAEAHLHGFATELVAPSGAARELYLRTSPELTCKKLLAAGETRIFEIARVWRNRERGALHHPEFTLLEWYRAEAPYEALMDDCVVILRLAADAGARRRLEHRGVACDPFAEPLRITVAEAFADRAGVDLLATVDESGGTDREALAAAARASGLRVAPDDTWADVFSRVMVARIEPGLGTGRPVILYEYPAPQAALAQLKPGDRRVAERFELYACGVELANAFGELTDPVEQRRRLEAEMADKARVYGETYPIDEDFLESLAEMPPASGAALGLDRLVMLATGATRVDDVLWASVPAP
jgi:lysyl-tRNA synthetase class 2